MGPLTSRPLVGRERPFPTNAATSVKSAVLVLAGGLLGIVGVLLLVPLTEVGLPVTVAALRILGRRFAWARRTNEWTDDQISRLRSWWRRQPTARRRLALAVAAIGAALLAWDIVRTVLR